MSEPWYARGFGARYLDAVGAVLTEERTTVEARFVVEALALPAGATVGDFACGHGRHALALARAGLRVVGVDREEAALARARDAARREPDEVRSRLRWVCGDLRSFEAVSELDGAYCYFSSFGYLESEAEDLRALEHMSAALAPGAPLLLECAGVYSVAQRWTDADEYEAPSGHRVRVTRRFDPLSGYLDEHYVFTDPGGAQEPLATRMRLYSASELRSLCARAGLRALAAYAAPTRAPYTLDSPRLGLLARRE